MGVSTKSTVVTAVTPSSPTSARRDFDALVSWLGTFSLLQGKYYGSRGMEDVLHDEAFAADMLCIANEIFDESFTVDGCEKNIDKTWRLLGDLLHPKSTQVKAKLQVPEAEELTSSVDARILIISALLWYGVSDECRQQRLYVSKIMSLSTKDQKVLMEIIENGRDSKTGPSTPLRPMSNDDTSATQGGDKDSSHHNLTESLHGEVFSSPVVEAFASPEESLFFPAATGPDELFSFPVVDSYTSKEILDLRHENDTLRKELEGSKLRETDLEEKMDRAVEKFRKEMIKRDSASMRRMDDVRKEHEQETSVLKIELSLLRKTNQKLEKQQQDSRGSTKSELEERLCETQTKLRLWKERAEALNDIKKELMQEEEAHTVSVEECHRLQNELKTLKPLKQKLAEYESSAKEAERKLAESGRKVAKLCQAQQESEQKYKILTVEVAELKEEADDLRRQLAEKELCSDSSSDSSEGGRSTLVARLRRENMRLLEFLAEVEQQSQCELNTSQEYVVDLQARIDNMSSKNKTLEAEIEERTSQLMESQASLSKTCNQLREAETKYETLQVDAAKWKQRADDAKMFTAQRQQLLNRLQSDMKTAMEDDKETIESLQHEMKEWMDMANAAEEALEKSMKEHSQAIQKYACSLDSALLREEALQQQNTELVRSVNELQHELDEERRLRDEAMVKSLDDKTVEFETVEGVTVKDQSPKRLMGLLVEERSVYQTQFDLLKAKYQQHISEVKQQATEAEARMEEEQNRHITTLINTLMEDMRIMESNQLVQADKEGQQLREALDKANQCHAAEKGMFEVKIVSYQDEVSSTRAHVERLSEENKNLKATLENLQRRDQQPKGAVESNDTITIAASGSPRNEEPAKLDESLMDLVTVMKAQIHDLQRDNDLLYRRLSEKLKSFRKVQDQFDTLQSEYNSLLGESKVLKRDNAKISSFQNCVVYALTGSTEVFSPSYTQSGFAGTTPAHLRKEYEIKMKSMIDEKRKLVIQSNSAMSDMQKAMQTAWEADQQVAILKKELRSAKLARKELQLFLERKGIQLDPELSDSLKDSSDSASTGDECSEHSAVEVKVDSTAPALLICHSDSNEIESLPLPSLSMDSIPPPPFSPRNRDTRTSSLSVSTDAIRVEEEEEFISDKHREQENSKILSPSSKDNHHHHVHWNEEQLWMANDGMTLVSPIKDRYAATIASPASK